MGRASAGSPGRWAATAKLVATMTALAVVGTAAPAGAEVVDPEPSLAERESWTLEERAAYGEDLWGERDDDEIEPLRPVDSTPTSVRDLSTVKGTTSWAQAQGAAASPTVEPVKSEVTVDLGSGGKPTTVGGVPVTLSDTSPTRKSSAAGGPDGRQVLVRSQETPAAKGLGVDGAVLSLDLVDAEHGSQSEGRDDEAEIDVELDVSGLPAAQSADWLARALLVELPACAVTTPENAECQERVPVQDSAVDTETGVVSGVVTMSTGAATVLAVEAGASGASGDWSATPLSPAASWQVSQQSGSFSWSYPMRTPTTPGGLEPDVSLSYDSGSIDGRVASTNNQAGQIGDGWSLNASGYVERRFVPCADDTAAQDGKAANNASHKTGDLCWRDDNATLMLGGKSSELIKDKTSGEWRLKEDDNSKVERLTGAWNGDNDKEYWKVTTSDGTQYFFGRDKRSADDTKNLYSAWTVPVYGNHSGEPCYASTFSASRCDQAWRWNLDYVVDASGNSMTYTYTRETNRYGYDNNTGTAAYVRGGMLRSIEYGTRSSSLTAAPSAKVLFDVAQRCLPTSTFDCAASSLTSANKSHWPDVPFDRICGSTTACAGRTVPTFFSQYRTTRVTTQVLTSAGTYRSVDRWDLTHQFPDPGDATDPSLWLAKVTHVGLGASTAVTLPATTFVGTQMANRVNTQLDGRFPMNRYRISSITSESGGVTTVNYSSTDCTSSSLPTSPQANTRRCMPVYWTPEGATEQVLEYFHKYVVKSVVENSRDAISNPVETHYSYVGDAAWHYDDDDLVRPKYRTWSQWRGYGTVDVKVGAPGVSGEPQVHTRYRYFRGMHGDRSAPSGGTRTVEVDGITDYDQFAGVQREQISYNGSVQVESATSVPWRSSATATNVDGDQAFHTGVAQTDTTTTLSGGTTRTARQVTTFDSYGSPTQVDDLGDVASSTDDRCTRTTYVRNTAKNILDTVQRTETVAVKCATTPSRPEQVISDQRFAYDGAAVGTAPTIGRVTVRQEADKYVSGAASYVTAETTTYDAFGRPTSVADALGRKTTTSYTDAAGLTTGTSVTTPDPDGTGTLTALKTTTVLDPAWGTPTKTTDANGKVTTGTYDALGRLTQVWEPGRVQGTHTPTTKFAYTVRSTGQNAVTTQTLNWDGSAYVSNSVIYDGLLRPRQTQSPSLDQDNPGRQVTDTFYDSRGLVSMSNEPWFTTGGVTTTVVASNDAKPGSTVFTYDGAGRATKEEFRIAGTPKWATTTSYGGDRVVTNPPTGGTATVIISDARGRTSVQRQFLSDEPTGSFQDTKYTYDAADRLVGVTDPAGNDWTYAYDLRGRQVTSSDPDKGATTTTYDNAGQVVTTKDSRGEVLAYTYDALGRKTTMRDDTTAGAVRAQWTYDTLAKGQLTKSVRNDAGVAYTLAVTGYDDHYRPLGQTVTVPSSQGALAGSYTTKYTYTVDGRVRSVEYPKAGNLGAEKVTTFFDGANQAERVGTENLALGVPWGAVVAGSDYSPYGQLLMADLGSNYPVHARWVYEQGSGRLTDASVVRAGQTALDYDAHYTYDAAGNVTSVADAPVGKPADVQCFDYDGLRRMTEAWTQAGGSCATTPSTSVVSGAAKYWTSYEFDKVGNRTQVISHATTTGGTDTTQSYAYPAAGSAKAHAVSSVTASGGSSGVSKFGYDESGNMTSRAVAGKTAQTLAWDAEGELAKVTEGSTVKGQYVYTADGERLLRTENGKVTLYLPGGMEVTASGSVLSAQRYFQFNGQTVAVRSSAGASGMTTVVADHHGTGVIQVAHANNGLSRRYADPYGQARGPAASWTGDRGFLDKTTDATGLVQVGARYYDPLIGRFISVDPVMDLSDPQQWNAYSYSNNNPLTWSDPSGMIPIGAGHVGYNPKQKNDPRKYDTCTHSTSCEKTVSRDGHPVRVRVSYTKRAYKYFSKQRNATTGIHINRVRIGAWSKTAGDAAARTGAASDLAGSTWERKKYEKSRLKVNSGNPARRAADRATLSSLRDSAFVRGATRYASNPFIKRAGVAGALLGFGAGFAKYSDDNGGDLELASAQAGFDVAAGLVGAAAGAKFGALVGSFGGPVGAAIGAGVGALIGGIGAGMVSSAINDHVSSARRESLWG